MKKYMLQIEIIKSYKKYLSSYPKLSKSDEIESIKTIDDVDRDFVLSYMTEKLLKDIMQILSIRIGCARCTYEGSEQGMIIVNELKSIQKEILKLL